MLAGLVASPTPDLARSRTALSKPPSTDSSVPAPNICSISPVARAAISIEYASLRHDRHCPTGIYVTPSAESMFIWDAVLFVHKGHYAGSIFKFVVTFTEHYPDRPPTVHFVTDVFHPLVASQTGMFNLGARFRPWRPKEHHVHDILYFVKAAFKESSLEKLNELDVVNKEAFKYKENGVSFIALAQQSSQLSQSLSTLYDAPSSRKAYSFCFGPTKPEHIDKVLKTLSIHPWTSSTKHVNSLNIPPSARDENRGMEWNT